MKTNTISWIEELLQVRKVSIYLWKTIISKKVNKIFHPRRITDMNTPNIRFLASKRI